MVKWEDRHKIEMLESDNARLHFEHICNHLKIGENGR